jgi:hypothetical protein
LALRAGQHPGTSAIGGPTKAVFDLVCLTDAQWVNDLALGLALEQRRDPFQ